MMNGSHVRPDVLTRTITTVSWMCAPLALACCVGIAIDDRTLVGESVWVKPLKFAVSIGLAGAATSWLRSRLPPARSVNVAAIAVVVALVGEQALISMQAARGVRSHFNVATPFDSAAYSSMGALVAVACFGLLSMAILGTRRRTASSVTDAVVRWGTWAVVIVSSVGFALVANGAHTIAAPDGGPGLPLLNWNTTHGDLRPGHFVGLHGLQLLIVLAALGTRAGWSERTTLAALGAAGVATIALTVGLVVQAYAEQPVTSASSIVVAAVAATLAWLVARRTPHTTEVATVSALVRIVVPT